MTWKTSRLNVLSCEWTCTGSCLGYTSFKRERRKLCVGLSRVSGLGIAAGIIAISSQHSGWESGHLQGDPLPEFFSLFSPFQVLQHIVELHHANWCQAKRPASTSDDVHKVVVVCWSQMDQPMVDILKQSSRCCNILVGCDIQLFYHACFYYENGKCKLGFKGVPWLE